MGPESEIRPDVLIEALRRTGYDRLAYLGRTCGANERVSDEYRRLLGLIESIPGVRPRNESFGERANRFTNDVFGPSRTTLAVRVAAAILIVVATTGLLYYRSEAIAARAEARKAHESSADKFEQSIQEFRKASTVWDARSYRHLAEQLANLYATDASNAWKPAAPDQLKFVIDWSRWANPENRAGMTDPTRTMPVAVNYYATWFWGMAEGHRRVKSVPKALEFFAKALRFAEAGFGPADALTLDIRTQYALALHGAGRDGDAHAVIDEGDRRVRDAVEGDPSVLDIRNEKGVNLAWGRLISLCAFLPPNEDGTRPEDLYWSRRIAICKAHPLHVHPNYWPTFEKGFTDYYSVTRHDPEPKDTERILRRKLDLAAETNPATAAIVDSAKAQINLADFLRNRTPPRFAEAELHLTAAAKTLKLLTDMPYVPSGVSSWSQAEPWDWEYERAIRSLTELYRERGENEKSIQWDEESARFRRRLKEKYPKVTLPK